MFARRFVILSLMSLFAMGSSGSGGDILPEKTLTLRTPDGKIVAIPVCYSDYGLGISGKVGKSGLRITEVSEGPAKKSGIEVQDMITSANGTRIQDGDAWDRVMTQVNGSVRLQILDHRTRRTVSRTITLPLPPRDIPR
ncbi:MAG: PDZ domain-containing protein [bacterium]|nr:PDZ domain-containing protein [bacterium]